ncbi:MAG: TetR/AcrR family transcriptional regulator [Psychroserpens sp.]|uniref:TetR/AcrR family transcriptional regulator n=1 Tax=Psychroserpens sp. TaxID=2020870 RepID=UPI0030028E57
MKRSFQIDMPKVEKFNRDYVVQQATNVFHDKGYNATSMQDLVDATGLNRSSIYNSFVNKLNLYLECLKSYEDAFGRDTSNALLKASNPLHAIELIFELYIKIISKNKEYDKGCLIGNCKAEMANHEKSITSFLEKNHDHMLKLLEDLVGKAQDDNLINMKQNSNNYAMYLFTSLQGLRMTGILLTDKKQLQGIASTIMQTLN